MSTFAMPQPAPLTQALLVLTASLPTRVELTADRLEVRLGLTWRADIPRSSIRSAEAVTRRTINVGAHGWHGRWLVNTVNDGLVRLRIEPAVRARCVGLRHGLSELTISLADPESFLHELGVSRTV